MKYLGESCSARRGTYFPHIPGPQSQSKSVEEVIIDTRAQFWLWSHSRLFSNVRTGVPNGICRCGVCGIVLFVHRVRQWRCFWKWPFKIGILVKAIYPLSTPQAWLQPRRMFCRRITLVPMTGTVEVTSCTDMQENTCSRLRDSCPDTCTIHAT